MNYDKTLLLSNYILKKPTRGTIYKQPGVVEEDMDWELPAGTLVTVYETPHNWVIERSSNFLPGCKTNVKFKAFVPKEN